MVVKLGYGVADLMYYHFFKPRLGLDYGLHPLNVDDDVLEMEKYGKDNKIILVYVEHRSSNVDSSIFVTPKKGVAITVDNHLRKAPIEINGSPDVNRNLTPMCHRNLTKEWEYVSSKALSIGEVMKILSDYANTREEITRKRMIVHVGKSSTVENVVDYDILYDTEGHDEVFDDDEHILKDVPVSMNNFNFNPDTKHDLSIVVVEVHEHDLDVINYDSFGSDLDDGIDSER
ncbi:hypothetical protein Tco_1531802 [Tanacetum coccineum]